MPLIPIELPPGAYRNGTDLFAKDRWNDIDLVRWHEGIMRPIGGWREFAGTTVDGIVRGVCGWRDNSNNRYLALGAFDALAVVETSGTVSDITPSGLVSGDEVAAINTGYGNDTYGTGAYGTPRDDNTIYTEASVWQMDNFGENLVACSSADGKLYEWTLNTASPAAVITNAPTDCEGLIVTEERFLFALGAGGDPRKVQWSDREDNTTWTPAATNQAGDIRLQTEGGIVQALRTRGQTVILTDVDAHTATFRGGASVYSFQRVGDNCGAISRQSGAVAGGTAYWMGRRGFYQYAGGAVAPLPSDVGDYVFSDINQDKFSHVWAVSNQQYNEIWWFYVSGGATEIDRYVAYNYRDQHWITGTLARTSGIDSGVWRYPMLIDDTGAVYEHEYAFLHGDMEAYAESGPVMLGAGDQVMVCTSLYPDEDTQGEVTATFNTRFYPNDTERAYGPYTMDTPTDVRFTGRQIRMRVTANTSDDWRVGIMRLEARPGGRR